MVHRDIKPENILIAPIIMRSKGTGKLETLGVKVAKLCDFGGAFYKQRGISVVGTPAYHPPEVRNLYNEQTATRKRNNACEKSQCPWDIFSLGIVIAELFGL